LLGKFVYEVEQMPAFELAEWRVFLEREAHGESRADWRAAMQAHVLAAVNGNKQSQLSDYLPKSFWPDES
jgi:hypothetical protein